jgi:hypothetical protein
MALHPALKEALDDGDIMVRIAYVRGMAKAAEDTGMDKEALLGALAKGLVTAGKWGQRLWSGGSKITGVPTKGLGGITGAVTKGRNLVAKPFEWAGEKAMQGLGKVVPQKAWSHIKPYLTDVKGYGADGSGGMFKGVGKDIASFGLLGGGLNAAMADPGERGSAFAKGFASSIPMAMAWGGTQNLLSKGLSHTMSRYGVLGGKQGVERLSQLAKSPVLGKGGGSLGNRAKAMGSRLLTGENMPMGIGLPFAGAWLASDLAMPSGEPPAQEGAEAVGNERQGFQQYRPYINAGQQNGYNGASRGSW